MIKIIAALVFLSELFFPMLIFSESKNVEYIIVANQVLTQKSDWMKVIDKLQKRHGARIVYYKETPAEVKEELKQYFPRYVAFVDEPERIGQHYVFSINRMSREMDDDVYVDFRWGIITGYDAEAALRLVDNAEEPLVLKTALSTTTGIGAEYFDRFALVSDSKKGVIVQKEKPESSIIRDTVEPSRVLYNFCKLYCEYDPDIVFSASHATENDLQMPFRLGSIHAENGMLYGKFSDKKVFLEESGKRRVYFPVGNCLIGNVNHSRESMAIAWLHGANVTGMLAYVVPTWYGRGGWGTLKVWLSSPGRYTLVDALFLNQQMMQHQLQQWSPKFKELSFEHEPVQTDVQFRSLLGRAERKISEVTDIIPVNIDHVGVLYDQDVMVYYGDPKWDVRLQTIPGKGDDFKVEFQKKGRKCNLTIMISPDFDLEQMVGNRLNGGSIGALPFTYIFPERLQNPRVTKGKTNNIVIDGDFILWYSPNFKPGKRYRLKIKCAITTDSLH